LYMNKKRKQQIEFHIQRDVYFGTVATVLGLLHETLGKKSADKAMRLRSLRLLKNVRNDFIFLQKRYHIVEDVED
jgi:hypothetical protein